MTRKILINAVPSEVPPSIHMDDFATYGALYRLSGFECGFDFVDRHLCGMLFD